VECNRTPVVLATTPIPTVAAIAVDKV